MKCIACNCESNKRLVKESVDYYQCISCGTLFSESLPNDNMVGGGYEFERNINHNADRLSRTINLFGDKLILDCTVLDFGCGNGMLVEYFNKCGVNTVGYDKFNEKFPLPINDKFDVIIMVEVIEHLSSPFDEINIILNHLKDDGYLYVETSFVDVAKEEGIELEDFFYISPSVGHSTIFSHIGLDILMKSKGFLPCNHINRNVRIYKKIQK